LDYPILADEKSEAAEAYGVVTKLRRFPHRHTFYISKEGKILAIDKDVNTKTAGKDIAEKLKELKIDKK
ncbi:MAG: peroxiredoxin Q/BCP, partial [Verrucomicrobiales bacterium]